MPISDEMIDQVHKFVSDFTISSPLGSENNIKSYSTGYRYFHALLIWREALVSAKRSKPNPHSVLQFEELLSDLSYFQFLALSGMYKPARMMLRSSIENLLRVLALEQGFSTEGAKFTFELVLVVRASKVGDNASPVRSDLSAVIDLYSDLCAYTHAAEKKFLALRVPFNELSKFDQNEFDKIMVQYRNVCQRFNRIIYWLYHDQLKNLSHKLNDYVLDAVPRSLKRAIAK